MVTGTVNMADLAVRVLLVPEADQGCCVLGLLAAGGLRHQGRVGTIAFGFHEPCFAASAPVAAFAIMTKVGATDHSGSR